jgi:cytochrome c553
MSRCVPSIAISAHEGTRKNDSGQLMRSVAQNLDDADVAAVSAFFATRHTVRSSP